MNYLPNYYQLKKAMILIFFQKKLQKLEHELFQKLTLPQYGI